MEPRSRQRKACDLCYNRKLKCDGQAPRCANCIIYAANCTHSARSRKWKPKGWRRNGTQISDTERIEGLRTEIQQLKDELARTKRLSLHDERTLPGTSLESTSSGSYTAERTETEPEMLSLPALERILPLLGSFLNNFNSILPLFDPDTLLSIVGTCYASPPHLRNPVAWAAICTVLALGSLHLPAESEASNATNWIRQPAAYIAKAESYIQTITLGETALLNVQTLVGMVMVLQTKHDLTPALILISATMRLVHKLGLHQAASSAHLDPTQRRQCRRVFWLAYILDKDLSLRAQQPSLQIDDDIDLPLPSAEDTTVRGDEGDGGLLVTLDRTISFDYFLARVQLANVEGAVYDSLYSVRSTKRTPAERSMARDSIVDALQRWSDSIPTEFRAAAVMSNTSTRAEAEFLCLLHSTSLQCMTLINRADSWDKQWVSTLREHGRGIGALQLPTNWGPMVQDSRDLMALFEESWARDSWLHWMTCCTYLSALMIVIADKSQETQQTQAWPDDSLIKTGLCWLNDLVSERPDPELETFRDICAEIDRRAREKSVVAKPFELGGDWYSAYLPER